MTPETLFGIGSIGKSLRQSVARIGGARQPGCAEPIATYLPWFKPDSAVPVAMRHLLSAYGGNPNMRMELQSSLYQALG